MTQNKLQTVDEYLTLQGWTFRPLITEGSNGNFVWFRSVESLLFHPLEVLDPPTTPFRVVILSWDSGDGSSSFYRDLPGWNAVGEWAVSPTLTSFPEFNFAARSEEMIIDASCSEEEISEAQVSYELSEQIPDVGSQSEAFWRMLDKLQPYCFTCESIFVARDRQIYERVINRENMAVSEAKHKARVLSYRQIQWENLGPEIGPEECVEAGCGRLRISLAVRCFMHQIVSFGKIYEPHFQTIQVENENP